MNIEELERLTNVVERLYAQHANLVVQRVEQYPVGLKGAADAICAQITMAAPSLYATLTTVPVTVVHAKDRGKSE